VADVVRDVEKQKTEKIFRWIASNKVPSMEI